VLNAVATNDAWRFRSAGIGGQSLIIEPEEHNESA
jgi:hypothetical protein